MTNRSGQVLSGGFAALPVLLSTCSQLYCVYRKHEVGWVTFLGPCLGTLQSLLPCMLDRVCARIGFVQCMCGRNWFHNIWIGMGLGVSGCILDSLFERHLYAIQQTRNCILQMSSSVVACLLLPQLLVVPWRVEFPSAGVWYMYVHMYVCMFVCMFRQQNYIIVHIH